MFEVLFVLAAIGLIIWFLYRVSKGVDRSLVHESLYALAILSSILTYSYFIDMDLDGSIKFLVSILGGFILIIAGVFLHQHE